MFFIGDILLYNIMLADIFYIAQCVLLFIFSARQRDQIRRPY